MSKPHKWAVVHFLPLEKYPPVMNFLRMLGAQGVNFLALTTRVGPAMPRFVVPDGRITRFGATGQNVPGWLRKLTYPLFYAAAFVRLCLYRPSVVLYYESYSAIPVYFYLRFVNSKARLLIHFHEYFSPQWYQQGMRTVRWAHRLEKSWLFGRAALISQTNAFRVGMFRKDHPTVPESRMMVVPNFPPLAWKQRSRRVDEPGCPLRTVYIGSVSLRATYLEDYVAWVQQQQGRVLFDVVSYTYDAAARNFLEQLQSPWVRFFPGGLPYDQIPVWLERGQYDVGIIFYKGLYDNTVFCASNKLFEYLACGLDVWCCREMVGSQEYARTDCYPKVLMVDYTRIGEWDVQNMTDREGIGYRPPEYFAEPAMEAWLHQFESVQEG